MNIDFFKKRKGSAVIDGIIIVIVLAVFGIMAVTAVFVYDSLYDDISESIETTTAQNMLDNSHDRTPSILDGIFVTIVVLFWIGAVILAYFIDSHPLWFALSFILVIILFVISGELANVYIDYEADLLVASLPMTSYIFNHLMHFIAGFIASVLISLFAKTQQG